MMKKYDSNNDEIFVASVEYNYTELFKKLFFSKKFEPTQALKVCESKEIAELLLDDPRVSNLTFEELKNIHNPKIGLLIAKSSLKKEVQNICHTFSTKFILSTLMIITSRIVVLGLGD